MSSFIDVSHDKLYKRRLTTLNSSTKFSNNNNNNKSNSSIRRTQLYSNSSNIILPSINESTIKHHSVLDSGTLISKLIKNYNPNNNQPKNKSLEILNPKRQKKSRNTIMIKSQSLNNIFIPERNKMKFQSQRVLISNKNKSDIFFNNNYYYISKNSSESDYDDTFINENDLYNINSIKNNYNNNNNNQSRKLIKSNSSSLIDNKILIHDLNKKNKINLKYLNLESNNFLNNSSSTTNNYTKYKRLRQFNKIFLTTIKTEKNKSKEKDKNKSNNLNKTKLNNTKNNNNSIIIEKGHVSNFYENNIKFQAKLFEEQVRLLNNSYREYKIYYNDENFIEVFKTKALDLKIKFNKAIEDACSILYYLPKLILKNFFLLMLNLVNSQIPNQEKLRTKYITNEIDTVKKNNFLLAEVINYFNKTFDFYLILSEKENDVPELKLNQQNFMKIIQYIKTARYNIIYLNNSFLNSKKKFLDDLIIIKKFLMRNKVKGDGQNNKKNTESKISKFSKNILGNALLLEKENNKNISAIEKIEKQFLFGKDEETQKKKKIENALNINKRKIIHNHLGKVFAKKNLFKSILWNKHLSQILKYCYDDVKNKIITEKITEQDYLRKKGKQSHKAIRFNFA